MPRVFVLIAAATLLATGCDDGGTESPDDDTSTPDTAPEDTGPVDVEVDVDVADVVEIRDLITIANPTNVLSYFVEWRTSSTAASSLSVTCGDDYDQSWTLDAGTDHRVFIMGLVAETTCDVRIDALDENGMSVGQLTSSFEVAALPDFLPELEVLVREDSAIEPGWTLINLGNVFEGVAAIAAIVDPQGRFRWYHQFATDFDGADHEVFVTANGVQTCGNIQRIPLSEIDWQGNQLWSIDTHTHHDCRYVDGDPTRIRYLSRTEDCPMGPSHTVVERSVPDGELLWEWKMCDYWFPEVFDPDWAHLNTVEPFPGENAFLVSSRTQHSLFKASRDTGEVLWQLGVDGDFAMADEDLFYRQHAADVIDNGNIVLFDNGNFETREYSRLIEIAYDETAMTAEVVWEYVPEPAIFAPIWGDADRQPNGNTLGTFGLRSETEHTHIIEVDANANEVWHLRLPMGWGTYRADRVAPVFGHVIEAD